MLYLTISTGDFEVTSNGLREKQPRGGNEIKKKFPILLVKVM